MRCSSVPSSVAVMGVGMSLFGVSMSAPEGLVWLSAGVCACSGQSWGGGVGSCVGTWATWVALLSWLECRSSFNARPSPLRDSSGGQVVRAFMSSCSTGETMASSGVGMVGGSVWGNHQEGAG